MQDLAFEELLEATMRLKPELRHVLMQLLHVTPAEAGNEDSFLQSEILSEASAYSVFTPLCNVQPHGVDATAAELLAAVQCLSCEWEEEAV